MRKLLIGPIDCINETGLDATTNGDTVTCENVDLVSFDVIWSNGNSPAATITIQKSNDNVNWRTLGFGSTISISGASGIHTIDVEVNFKYLRPVVTFSSGDCDLQIEAKGTTTGA